MSDRLGEIAKELCEYASEHREQFGDARQYDLMDEAASFLLKLAREREELVTMLAKEREKFTMHTAQVGAWLSALADLFGVAKAGETVDVATTCSKIMDEAERARTLLREVSNREEHAPAEPAKLTNSTPAKVGGGR